MNPWEQYAAQGQMPRPAVTSNVATQPVIESQGSNPWEQYGQQAQSISGFERVRNIGDGAVYRNSETGNLAFKGPGFSTTDQAEIQALLDGANQQDVRTQKSAELTLEQNPGLTAGGGAANFLAGLPAAGEYFDEGVGLVAGDKAQQQTRDMRNIFAQANPKTATGLQIGGGVTGTLPLAMAAAPAIGSRVATLGGRVASTTLGRMAAGGLAGVGAGGIEGAISGYGSGVDPQSRIDNAFDRAETGAMIGGVFGGAAPLAGSMVKGFSNLRAAGKSKKATGLSKQAEEMLTRALDADNALGDGASRIREIGNDAFLADAGPNARALLDTAIQKSGPAGVVARDAIEGRATTANQNVRRMLDKVLGTPQGISQTARGISQGSAAARNEAYQAAYSTPIDYSTGAAGDNILKLLKRVPDRVMKQAIDSANEAMQFAGVKNQQILADIADNGSVTFKKLPNVQQLDEIKRALGDIASRDVDQFGRATASGSRAGQLARELRDTIGEAVPSYRTAVQIGGDKIAEDRALDLGTKLLKPGTTRETVSEFAENASDAERTALLSGVRSQFDESLANVKRTVADGNMDSREAIRATKDLSSRANREKLTAVLGEDSASKLFGEFDKTVSSLDLRQAVADNSKTFARQNLNDTIRDQVEGGVANAFRAGEGLNASKRIWQAFTGATPQAKAAKQDEIYSEITKALTSGRGKDALKLFEQLKVINERKPRQAKLAEQLAQRITAGVFAPSERLANLQAR